MQHSASSATINIPVTSTASAKAIDATDISAIDSKIEQAMDLVKSHVTFAVRQEVEELKQTITTLQSKVVFEQSLECDNNYSNFRCQCWKAKISILRDLHPPIFWQIYQRLCKIKCRIRCIKPNQLFQSNSHHQEIYLLLLQNKMNNLLLVYFRYLEKYVNVGVHFRQWLPIIHYHLQVIHLAQC